MENGKNIKWSKWKTSNGQDQMVNSLVVKCTIIRKMPGGGYGVYADVFKKGRRVMTPGGKHRKELKKVYKKKKMQMIKL